MAQRFRNTLRQEGAKECTVRVGIVIDSACDLPRSFIQQHHLEIMPINLKIGDDIFIDERD